MNATDNGPDLGGERQILFAEIAALKEQRDALMRRLTNCIRRNRELRAEINQLRGDS